MPARDLTPRQQEILRVVIHDYIMTAEPVGSRSVSRHYLAHLSPATIRNTMADLEEMGLLAQPYTSAGRTPTEQGYRVYVDSLMETVLLSPEEAMRIERRVRPNSALGTGGNLMQEASRILAALAQYPALVLAPTLQNNRIRRIDFIQLHRERILVVLVTESGLVQNKVIVVDEVIAQEELDRISRYLNGLVEGCLLRQVRERIVSAMREEKLEFDRLLERALMLAAKTLESDEEGEVYVGGASTITRQPEFADVDKMHALFAAFEEKSKLVKILDQCLSGGGFKIIIGSENGVLEMCGMSVVASPYHQGDTVVGAIGILGPTRMPYEKAVALVQFTADRISTILTERDL